MAIQEDDLAFPSPIAARPSDGLEFSDDFGRGGMSLRAYIATQVCAGMYAGGTGSNFAERAVDAVTQADALIAALNEERQS